MAKIPAAGEVWIGGPAEAPAPPIDWVWQGLIAPRNLTLLTGQPKAGKTTLLSVLLGLRVAGGELGGLAVKPGNTLVITEEPPSSGKRGASSTGSAITSRSSTGPSQVSPASR